MTGPTDRHPREDLTTVELPRVPDDPTAETPTAPDHPGRPTRADDTDHPGRPGRAGRSGFWRELSGALAAGLLILALVVLGIQILDWTQGMPGPGIPMVIGHFLCAIAALALQRQADRRRGPQAGLAILLIGITTGIAVWFYWWA